MILRKITLRDETSLILEDMDEIFLMADSMEA